jgi:meso-butanediol dehydrogenase/(S,S)-butanediol dehydrogenase/diacetyl reductase
MAYLQNRIAIVTGGGSGIGRGIALALAAEGATVAICGRSIQPLEKTCEEVADRGGTALPIICDVMVAEQLQHLVDAVVTKHGTVDILINNAMVIPRGTLLRIADDAIEKAWLSGPIAALKLMRLCHPYLRNGGSIINVSSGAALRPDEPLRGIYGSIKAALSAISRAAAVEWASEQIRVNVVIPLAHSDAYAALLANEPELAAKLLREVPLGRVGDPETDIGPVVAFLCGPKSSFITGATLPIDGGRSFLR